MAAPLLTVSTSVSLSPNLVLLSPHPLLPPPRHRMDFLRQVETLLRNLAFSAREANCEPVKEASERGVVKLRELRSRYAREVRERERGGSKSI